MTVTQRLGAALAVALGLALAVGSVQPVAPAVAAATAPVLQVQGNRIVDLTSNTTFVPRGVNVPGLEYSCVQGWRMLPASGEFAAMASWEINTIRLPLNESCWLGLDGAPSGSTVAQYKADVKAWVDGANAVGIAVILDLHWNAPAGYTASGQRAMADERSTAFWTSVATAYVGNRSVMFELFNEPYSRSGFTLTWDCWKNGGCRAPVENDETGTLSGATYAVTGMQAMVTAVRATGAVQPVLLGGLNYSNDMTGWLANKPTDPAEQLVAAWHNYPGQGCGTSCWNSTITTLAASVPIVTTEFGNTAETTSTAAGNSGNYLVPFMTWADSHGIGYMPWAWWDVSAAESPGNSVYALYSGASFTPKSPSGTKFYAHLTGSSPPVTPPALTPGTLVKSATGASVFLVDGATRLVPLSSFDSVSDAGLGTAFATVPQSVIDGYAIQPAPLSNAVVCSGSTFVAGEGRLWPVTPALVAGLATTTLDPSTCAAMPKSPTTIQGALFLMPKSGGTIFAISAAGAKRPIMTMETLGAMSAPHAPVYLRVGATYLASLPTGPVVLPTGRLVKSTASPSIYLADGFDRLVPVANFSTATDAGIPTSYFTVTASELTGVSTAASVLTNAITCGTTTYFAGSGQLWPVSAGVTAGLASTTLSAPACAVLPKSAQALSTLFVKSASNSSIYNVSAGTKRPVISMATIPLLSAPGPGIWLTVGDAFIAPLPMGTEVIVPGMLVKTPTSPTVYLVSDESTLVPVRHFDSVSDMGLSTAWSTIAQSTANVLSIAPGVLNNVISCGGQTFLATGGRLLQLPTGVAGSLPVTAPSTSLCAIIPRGAPLTGAVLIKPINSATVFQLVGGQKRPIGSWATAVALSGGGAVTFYALNDPWVNSVPTGALLP